MKRLIPLACVPAVVSILITTSPSQGEITGSLHDFSSSSWSGNQICLPCHTPHGADTSVPDAPLWNHATSTANFTLYTSTSLDATVSQPTGRSLLCLSCHDGTVARDSFGGNTGTRFISPGSTSHIGTDLRDDHPVSFTFNTALATADGGLHDPATQSTALGGTIASDFLFNGRVECSSCHDVHNQQNNAGLLWVDNTGSALCLTCHDK
ncbi:MAG: putative CXXCH cytochrome family protein [Verrucomicrobiales bacterium]|jgi:predicted CXXCH cytochrome family protein